MWDVQRGEVREYEGGYSDYVFARAERDAGSRRRRSRSGRTWPARSWPGCAAAPPARTSKPRYRIEAANALIADVPEPRDKSELMKFANARLGRTVFELEDVTVTGRPQAAAGAR